ncbi:hypothetical protein GGTG_05640 [Gaeumannomyces tritici R3-111a-1]|uniref:Uncharacterized protein n=1 Tax=Gaeumannomyces tritici (strain R3-111a-1) TaxID=644352 RepID=J3NWH6_GAET3|nr:hypothetical protein GGTG_05640 [Gaeumannomyces tritici R3-111a-1]EJT75708.1 hypothetical protein GGTG_05640 [Gaeumannomyces tritici R3-111a-1]
MDDLSKTPIPYPQSERPTDLRHAHLFSSTVAIRSREPHTNTRYPVENGGGSATATTRPTNTPGRSTKKTYSYAIQAWLAQDKASEPFDALDTDLNTFCVNSMREPRGNMGRELDCETMVVEVSKTETVEEAGKPKV